MADPTTDPTTDKITAEDAAARRRIETSLDESLLVEAAAGTGKTTVLVKRLVALLASGKATVDRIVAVTFTRKAAGELKLRLRQELDRAREQTVDATRRSHLEASVARLEEAQIGTIHSFCAEVLRERPVEAAIDPAFREIDEQAAAALYDRAFQGWIEASLEAPSSAFHRISSRLALQPSFDGSSPLRRLREAARSLVDWRDFPTPWRRQEWTRNERIDAFVQRLEELAERFHQCRNRHDYLRKALEPVAELATWIRRSETVAARDHDELEARLIDVEKKLRRNLNWTGRGQWFAPELRRQQVIEERQTLLDELEDFRRHADADLAARLRDELAVTVTAYDALKRRNGSLDFLDLLLCTRDLVQGNGEVRAYLQQRYSHLFVDEFQDTDPLQAEILLLLAADDPAEDDWREARPVAGKLFLVGDPKQSIYRFRRADVLLYQQIKQRLCSPRGGVTLLHLSRSFRAVRPLQEAINAAFAAHMEGDLHVGQPQYIPMVPDRQGNAEQPQIVALPAPAPFGWSRVTKTQIEACLPETVAAFLHWVLEDSGWTIEDPARPGRRLPIRPKHIALLFRRFLSWNQDISGGYVRSLEARGIPHLLVGGRSFHQREEVETLRAALTAIEWPDDELSVFATLKGDLFAIPDDLLLRFRHESGSLHPFRPRGDELSLDLLPIVEALDFLAMLHRQRHSRPIVDTVQRLLEHTRAQAGFALRPAGNQVLANVQHVCDLARSFEMRGGLSFRGFVEELQEHSEHLGTNQAPVLEEGADGVRVMTAHAAKGLEFPVVVLADISANLHRRDASSFVDTRQRLAAHRLLGCAPWELIEHGDLEVERDRAEGIRLAYVAATRARDLLIVPTVGTGPWDGGWVSPLNDALYPDRQSYAKAQAAPGCPPFGTTTVLKWPERMDGPPPVAIRPGLHRPLLGEHGVVWWDPALLQLGIEGNFGLRREQILSPDAEGSAAADRGLRHYETWQRRRQGAIERGKKPQLDILTPSEARQDPPGEAAAIEWQKVDGPRSRPSGARFGTLVHTVLRDAELAIDDSAADTQSASAQTIADLAALHGRLLDATADEITAAEDCVRRTLAHPLLQQAAAAERCHREAPILLPLTPEIDASSAIGHAPGDGAAEPRPAEGTLLEGTLDLLFYDGTSWVVVDFKTDVELSQESRDRYQQQLAWYLYAVHQLFAQPVRGVLLQI